MNTVCPICKKTLSDKYVLRRHILGSHSNVNVDEICPIKQRCLVAEFQCPFCSKIFCRRDALKKHAKRVHADMYEGLSSAKTVAKIKQPTDKVICCKCQKSFSEKSYLRKHAKLFHSDTSMEEICPYKSRRTLFVCSLCGQTTSNKYNMDRHMASLHKDVSVACSRSSSITAQHSMKLWKLSRKLVKAAKRCRHSQNQTCKEKPSKRKFKCSISCCTEEFYRMSSMIAHLEKDHFQTISVDLKHFECSEDFHKWLIEEQTRVPCNFVKRTVIRRSGKTEYFSCSRSGYERIISSERKRHMKVQGSCKINRACPARILSRWCTDGSVSIRYVSRHLCHTDLCEQLGHIRLTKADRLALGAKLSQGIPMDLVLRDVRDSLNGDLKRLHIATKQDLRNISASFGLTMSERLHANDSTSVDALIKSYAGSPSNPFILYKPQGSEELSVGCPVVDRKFPVNDLMVVMMDNIQCTTLQLYGSGDMSVVCIDSTHGTNSYDFHLTTIMVLDSNRQGFPVAFLYSNRLTEETFEVFFEVVREKAGHIVCNTFMSDMAPQFHNAWRKVMGESNHRLFCAWHVDKSFRENCVRLIRDNREKVVEVYQNLRTLMDEQDTQTFTRHLSNFLVLLKSDATTHEFLNFFENQYVGCVESWAYCYRAHCGVNTNMHLERMHGIFKHTYLHGKRNKRLDSAIQALIKLVRDKQFSHLTGLCKGKYTKKLSELRSRHAKSLELDVFSAEIEAGREWCVRSEVEQNEYYTVSLMKDVCSCDLVCSECNACIHKYSCTCCDCATQFNMCKHIHFVCRVYCLSDRPHQSIAQLEDEEENENWMIDADEGSVTKNDTVLQYTQELSKKTKSGEDKRKNLLELTARFINSLPTDDDCSMLDAAAEDIVKLEAKYAAMKAAAAHSSQFKPQESTLREPANKQAEQQRRFVSTKKQRVDKSRLTLSKPNQSERRTIQDSLCVEFADTDRESDLEAVLHQ